MQTNTPSFENAQTKDALARNIPATNTPPPPERPTAITGTRRRLVKKMGKKIIRALARIQSKSSKLEDTPYLDNAHFPFMKKFEENWEAIAQEAREVMKYKEEIPGFQDISPDQYRIAKGRNWKTFILFGFGDEVKAHTKITPICASLLREVPHLQTAMFSILSPGYHIPAHTGVTKGILRAHLGLIIPKQHENCRIRVHDKITAWQAGQSFVFDDTYEHEVWNDTPEERVILLFDFNRPMGLRGRAINSLVLMLMKRTAFIQQPRKNLQTAEARFEAAVKRAEANIEALSDD